MKITEAAIKYGQTIVTGRRHNNCFRKLYELVDDVDKTKIKQGFVTEDGKFLDRMETLVVVRMNGQLTKPLIGSVLTSEDLW